MAPRVLLWWLIAFFRPEVLPAAEFPVCPANARAFGMSSVGTALTGGGYVYSNPAALAADRNQSLTLASCNRFMIPELSQAAVSWIVPAGKTTMAFDGAGFGFGGFSMQSAGLTMGRNLGPVFRAGIGIHGIYVLQAGEAEDYYAVVPSVGLQWQPTSTLCMGIDLFNPLLQEYSSGYGGTIPHHVTMGAVIRTGETLLTLAELTRNEYGWFASAGFELSVNEKVVMRFGLASRNVWSVTMGGGFRHGSVSIDLAVDYHPVLGASPVFSLNYAFIRGR